MSTTFEVRALHDAQKVGRNRHARKHAHVASTRVAEGHAADRRSDGAKNDANSLPHRGDGLMTTNGNREHQPMRKHVPANMRLAEDVRAFEMKLRLVEVACLDQLFSQLDFPFEQVLVGSVHAKRYLQLECHRAGVDGSGHSARKCAWRHTPTGQLAADKRPSRRAPEDPSSAFDANALSSEAFAAPQSQQAGRCPTLTKMVAPSAAVNGV